MGGPRLSELSEIGVGGNSNPRGGSINLVSSEPAALEEGTMSLRGKGGIKSRRSSLTPL